MRNFLSSQPMHSVWVKHAFRLVVQPAGGRSVPGGFRLKGGLQTGAALAGSLVALFVAGCSIPMPQAETDPTRFYVLTAPMSPASDERRTDAPTVRLRQVEVPSYMRAQPIVVRRGDNEIQFREFARWGEPLEGGIARVLRDELLARGAASAVVMPGFRMSRAEHDREVAVRVLACEGGADGDVRFRAVWEVLGPGPKPAVIARGGFDATDLRWDGKDEAELVAKLSEAVAGLAGEIVDGLKK